MNEENIIIIGDDLATQPTSPKEPDPAANEGTWLAGRKSHFAETFLQQHQSEFQDYERREREKMSCADRFRELETELTARRQWLASLRADLAEFQAADVPAEILKNMQNTGRSLPEIAQSPVFSAAVVIREHGKTILRLAEKEVAALQNKFDLFKKENHELLTQLG